MMYLLLLREVVLEVISTLSDTDDLVLKLHFTPVPMLLKFYHLCRVFVHIDSLSTRLYSSHWPEEAMILATCTFVPSAPLPH